MVSETTIGKAVRLRGVGLHTGQAGTVTLHPAGAGHGRRIVTSDRKMEPVPVIWEAWSPSAMSTSVAVGPNRTIRTIEHLTAALTAYEVDHVLIEVAGHEIPIFDGSAAPWCRALRNAGIVPLDAARRAIRLRKPLQVERDGGFLRAEPAPRFEVDVTHDVLPGFPVMRWHGLVHTRSFDQEIARARSFGNLRRRLGLAPAPTRRPTSDSRVSPNLPDPSVPFDQAGWRDVAARQSAIAPHAPLLKGWRPWRATVIVGGRILPWRRFADEPVRHVTLDMIGDLSLVGAPIVGRIVAHNPSHEKTFALVSALVHAKDSWDLVPLDEIDAPAAA